MGCDIHVGVEVLREEFESPANHQHALARVSRGRRWKYMNPPSIEIFKNADGSPYMAEDWYFGRNYNLFSWLADVRNDGSITPLDDPRGVPSDISPEGEEHMDDYGVDGHSHSWFTLAEMLEADLAGTTTESGVVTLATYQRYRDNGELPTSWCGGVGGGGVTVFDTTEEADAYLAEHPVPPESGGAWATSTHYVPLRWEQETTQRIGTDWFEFLDRIKPLSETGTYEDVRVIFFFDN